MSNELDELMDRDPLELTREDIDKIIAHHRKNRGLVEAGKRPSKERGPAPSLDGVLKNLTAGLPKAGIARKI